MEQLEKEKLLNLEKLNKSDEKIIDNKLNKNNIRKTNSEKSNKIKKNPIKKQHSKNTNEINENMNKLKNKNLKNYKKYEIILRSIKFSSTNWKFNLFQEIQYIFNEILSLSLPIHKAKILKSITKDKNIKNLQQSVFYYIFLLFLKFFINEILNLITYFLIKKNLNKYRNIILSNIAEKDIEFFDMFQKEEILERINKSENTLQDNFIFKTINFIQTIFKFCFFTYYLYNNNFTLTLVSLILYVIKFSGDYIIKKYTNFISKKKLNNLNNNYQSNLSEFISNIRLIKSFGMEKYEINKLINQKINSFFQFESVFLKFFEFINKSGENIILLIAGTKTLQGEMTYADLSIFRNYFKQLKNSFNSIQNYYYIYNDLFNNWKQFFEIYDYQPKINNDSLNLKPEKIEGKITFKNVCFSYPVKFDNFILKNLNFEINPGKIFAIVGYSKSGKTTITNLLQRFYDPNSGDIFLDNYNLKNINLNYLHQNIISIVHQEPILNSGTIKDNILYGINEYSQEDFERICELSNLNFINDELLFPKGYKTNIGEKQISNGQKQRIAIARTLMKESKILIIDEITSSLDAESENEVQKAIDNIIKNYKITIIIISHKLNIIKNADYIIFLDKGNIIEFGRHQELIKKNGFYQKLMQKQLINEKEFNEK